MQRPEAGNHQVREILTHAAFRFQYEPDRCGDGGRSLVILELGENTPRQIVDSVQKPASGLEGLACVCGEGLPAV